MRGNRPRWCSVCANTGLIVLSRVFTRTQMPGLTFRFLLAATEGDLGPHLQTQPAFFTRVRRSRFPHWRRTTLHLQISPTLLPPVRSACAERRRSRFTPCLVLRLHESRSLKINSCHYSGRCRPELRARVRSSCIVNSHLILLLQWFVFSHFVSSLPQFLFSAKVECLIGADFWEETAISSGCISDCSALTFPMRDSVCSLSWACQWTVVAYKHKPGYLTVQPKFETRSSPHALVKSTHKPLCYRQCSVTCTNR